MPVLSAFENVELPLLLTPLSRRERRERVELTLEMVNLADRMDHTPNELSGGQQQRVAIARAIVTDPTLIVADEPTGDLDRNSAAEILALLQQLNRELGKTIIMVTHDAHAAAQARTVHLEKGELLDAPVKRHSRHVHAQADYRATRCATSCAHALTVLGLVVAVLAFGLLQTVINAWYAGAEAASNTTLVTRNATSLVFPLPLLPGPHPCRRLA
jgi:ABC-type methionine transport system ATPase subunit